ncbi:hypothetical protein ACISU4_06610 [Streptomyces wuyuanensis]|uniref:hypothetical protein n=1 Tax=Streptomyces wuyuanensis TaxID=1196353 RepID=UPI0037F9D421
MRWNDSTVTLFISVYAPGALLPDGLDVHEWAEAGWHPQEEPGRARSSAKAPDRVSWSGALPLEWVWDMNPQ